MKKPIFLLIAIAAILSSCSNSELASVKSLSSSATASISGYVATNYPDAKIFNTTVSGSTVIATLNTGEQITFNADGSMISYANNFSLGLKADSLVVNPDSIPKDSLGRPGHGGMGFGDGKKHGGPDGQGGSTTKKGGGPGCGGPGGPGYGGPIVDSTHVGLNPKPGHDRHFKNEIVVDSLPVVINDYIITNYAAYTVIHAEIDTLCQGAVTEVMVCAKGIEPVKLVFGNAGVYLFKAERILYTEVPTLVSAAVTADYATYKTTRRAEKLTLADGTLQYVVFVQLAKVRKMVTFSADGTVVCEK